MHHYFFFIFGVDISSGPDFPNLNPHPKSSQSKLNLWQGDENDPNNNTNFNDIFLRLTMILNRFVITISTVYYVVLVLFRKHNH